MSVTETAYAKINLALHVRRRREDGYHELETLFAFVDAGDVLTATPAARDSVTTLGEFAGVLDNPFDNLVARALSALPRPQGLSVTLEKNLPVAAGGAHIGLGTGAGQESGDDGLAGTPVLLVNPRVPLSTGPVFKAWDGADRGPLPDGPASRIAREGRNDLEAPAIFLCPMIAEVLVALETTQPWLARMSGSGATCFALYDTPEARDAAAAAMPKAWWTMAGRLR